MTTQTRQTREQARPMLSFATFLDLGTVLCVLVLARSTLRLPGAGSSARWRRVWAQ